MVASLEQFLTGRSTATIAHDLLGKQLQLTTPAGSMSAWIVETEAYLGIPDAGAHAYQNHQTARNGALWAAPGTIYIYQMRALFLLNLVVQPAGTPECVLIRGIEPAQGRALMMLNRPRSGRELSNGPGKLMQALGLDKTLNGQPLDPETLNLSLTSSRQPRHVTVTPRIGIVNKGPWTTAKLRYYVTGNPYVSKLPARQIDAERHGWQN